MAIIRERRAWNSRRAQSCSASLLHVTADKEITMFALNQARPEPETSQFSINELAERRLHTNPYLALKGVSCDCLDGVLFLRGCLPTYYLKQRAQEVVGGLKGVERIDNQIRVLTPTPSHQG
jgi:osmotically-inducible protein OsmY